MPVTDPEKKQIAQKLDSTWKFALHAEHETQWVQQDAESVTTAICDWRI